MKKRLLITSIVMMLVVAVALSTATYAWFTSNDTVTASTVTMTAATNEADSIFIKWDTGTYGKDIVTTKSYSDLAPMVPNELVNHQTTIGAGDHQITFKTAGLETVASVSTFKSVETANGVYFASGTGDTPASKDTIFIKNTSTANVVTNIKVTATFTPDYVACQEGELAATGYIYYERGGSEPNYTYTAMDPQPTANTTDVTGKYKATVELVRVAVFTRDLTAAGANDTTSDYILRGVLANSASNTFFGVIANGDSQDDFRTSTNGTKDFSSNKITATAGATGFNICFDAGTAHTLAAQGEVEIKVLMWLDGEALNDNTQGAIAKVALSFAAV